jgi:hypothetical protein
MSRLSREKNGDREPVMGIKTHKIEWFFETLKVLNNLVNKPCLTILFMKNRTATNFP